MKRMLRILAPVLVAVLPAAAAPPEWHFGSTNGVLDKLVWQTEAGRSYDLFQSADLSGWTRVVGFLQQGTGAAMEYPFTPDTRGFFRITSESPNESDAFALIPAGSFLMGDQSNPLVGLPDELPVHNVYVSGFYMAKYEVTKALWDAVADWAAGNGYDINAGGAPGKRTNHPVYNVTWYECVKWCNARSQKEGLTPCYTVSGAVYKTAPDNTGVACNFGASGYRLPTEAEWEKAARGGLTGLNFPWGNTISHSQANYRVYSITGTTNYYSYDVTPRPPGTVYDYYHPAYSTGSPYTSPVGSFAPNGYGLYDMSGNLWEWCWDWYSSSYYSGSPGTDPRGAAPGSGRVLRGSSWSSFAINACCAYRSSFNPGNSSSGHQGFRVARSSVP